MGKTKILTLSVLVFVLNAYSLESNIPSQVPGLDIPNSHVVGGASFQESTVFRGMAPRNRKDYYDLKKLGITDVIIFKNQTHREVDDEVRKLKYIGIKNRRITRLSFPWKDVEFKPACEMSLAALKKIEYVKRQRGRKIFFHCTVGEDRTGSLAGLYLAWNTRYSMDEIFENEMCVKGYSAGNPKKPKEAVVEKIRETLTPAFLKISFLLRKARLQGKLLNEVECIDPKNDSDFQRSEYSQYNRFVCDTSPYLRH